MRNISVFQQLFYSGPPFETLYRDYALQHHIDKQAAVQAVDDILINAPTHKVWEVLADVNSWASSNPIFSNVRFQSEIAVGAKGSFRLNGFPIKATFAVVDPGHELSWVGEALWTKAIDRLVLEPTLDGSTRLRLEESLAGVLVPLMSSSARLHKQHQMSLGNFKAAAEAA
jgi:hypothetical protein